MIAVVSSNISHIDYDPSSRTLSVRFKRSGLTYNYFGVSPQRYAAFLKAPSLGTYFNTAIKPAYKFEKVS